MKYARVYDDRSLFGEPLTLSRLMEDGFSEEEAKKMLDKIEKAKREEQKMKTLRVKIPEDVYAEIKEIEERAGDNIDHVTEMLLRAGLDVWNKKFKPKE